jgi:U3 small nucleolar RNA-associated protein 12
MDVDIEQNLVLTGSGEGETKVWKIDYEALTNGLRESETGEVICFTNILCHLIYHISPQVAKMIHSVDNLPLSSRNRVSQISFHPSLPYLAVQSHDRSVEIFRIRTEEELRKKKSRRLKRAKSKGKIGLKEGIASGNGDEDDEIKIVDLFTPHLVVRASAKIRSFKFRGDEVGHKDGSQVSRGRRLQWILVERLLTASFGVGFECFGGVQHSPAY